jgi:hypothetical protein
MSRGLSAYRPQVTYSLVISNIEQTSTVQWYDKLPDVCQVSCEKVLITIINGFTLQNVTGNNSCLLTFEQKCLVIFQYDGPATLKGQMTQTKKSMPEFS